MQFIDQIILIITDFLGGFVHGSADAFSNLKLVLGSI